jgi:hypothetical protein
VPQKLRWGVENPKKGLSQTDFDEKRNIELESGRKGLGSKKRGGVGLKRRDTDVDMSLRESGPLSDGQKRGAISKINTNQALSCETIDTFTEEQDTDLGRSS